MENKKGKTSSRYLNDLLFNLSFGAILIGLTADNRFLEIQKPQNWLLAIFFLLFRLKAFLDDSKSLIEKEESLIHNQISEEEFNAFSVQNVLVWFIYVISGYLITVKTEFAYLSLSLSFIVTNLWLIVQKIFFKASLGQILYFIFNLLYIGLLVLAYVDVEYINRQVPILILIGFLGVDIIISKSFTKFSARH